MPSLSTSLIDLLGLQDVRLGPSDWSLEQNPFWTSFALSLILYPCLFYLTWHLNPSLSQNRSGLSWVLGFYSASLFTLAGLYEVPHLRTIFSAIVDYQQPLAAEGSTIVPLMLQHACNPLLMAASASTVTTTALGTLWALSKTSIASGSGPSFLHVDSNSKARYPCFSDLDLSPHSSGGWSDRQPPAPAMVHAPDSCTLECPSLDSQSSSPYLSLTSEPSLRHRVFQAQMTRPHLFFSLENYPDDGRIGPHIIAANFQAFLVVDLLMGLIYYRKQLEVFSTVVHHIIYYFIVVHMRKGDMLSVFCICGTPIEISSIFLAWGRMFPHRRTKTVERLYLAAYIGTRLTYVSLLWHEIYFNYPDKSVAFLYTITLSLHVYWFILYLHLQKKYQSKQARSHLCHVLQSLATTVREESLRVQKKTSAAMSAASPVVSSMSPTFRLQARFESAD